MQGKEGAIRRVGNGTIGVFVKIFNIVSLTVLPVVEMNRFAVRNALHVWITFNANIPDFSIRGLFDIVSHALIFNRPRSGRQTFSLFTLASYFPKIAPSY